MKNSKKNSKVQQTQGGIQQESSRLGDGFNKTLAEFKNNHKNQFILQFKKPILLTC